MKKGFDFFKKSENENGIRIQSLEKKMNEPFPQKYRDFIQSYDPVLILEKEYDKVREFEFPIETVFVSQTKDFDNPIYLSELLSIDRLEENILGLKQEMEWVDKKLFTIGFSTSGTAICISFDLKENESIWEFNGDSNTKYKLIANDFNDFINGLESITPYNNVYTK